MMAENMMNRVGGLIEAIARQISIKPELFCTKNKSSSCKKSKPRNIRG
jgi:hypothetical protein